MPHSEAQRFYDLGLNLVSVKPGTKAPTIGWMGYQSERIPWRTLESALNQNPDGYAVITGEVSQNLAVLDFDDAEAYHRWNRSGIAVEHGLPTSSSGRGFHVFIRLKSPQNGKLRLQGETDSCGDLLGSRKLAILPPTRHPSGSVRTWERPFLALPPFLTLEELGLELVTPEAKSPSGDTSPSGPYLEGSRNQTLVSQAGKLRNFGMDFDEILSALLALNSRRCSPPLSVGEVTEIARWASTKEIHHYKEYQRDDDGGAPENHHNQEAIGNDDSEKFASWFLSLPDYLQQSNAETVEWLIEDFLPVGYLAILGGTSKVGKSCFLTTLVGHVAEGREFLGKWTSGSPVLWCALEESETERRIALESYDGEPPNIYITHEKIYIDSKEGIQALRYWVRKTGAKLIIIDPLYAANTAESLTDGATARRVLQPLKDLCREEQVSAILVHHLNKNSGAGMDRSRMADSNQLLASVSMDILMDAEERGDGSREITLKSRGRGEFANMTWVIRSPEMGKYELLRRGSDADSSREETDSLIIESIKLQPLTARQIAEATRLNFGTVSNRMTDLTGRRRVRIVGKDGRSNLYGLDEASGE